AAIVPHIPPPGRWPPPFADRPRRPAPADPGGWAVTSTDDLLDEARRRITRVSPADLEAVAAGGGLIIDIRPSEQRRTEGELDGALVIERNVLEWRLDPTGSHRIPEVR